MDDLLQKQIVESCRLALPNGLKELMSDLSREVLRAQPSNLYKFITDYLSSLLVTRDNMTIAARICSKLCECSCGPELDDELRYIGLDEETASDVKKVIEKFLGKGEVDEGHLLLKLIKKTSLSEDQLPAVTAATRRAFLRHLRNSTHIYESSSSSADDETTTAVRNTLRLYRKTEPGSGIYHCMARKIQASYRAYRVRRQMDTRKLNNVSKKCSRTGSLEKSKVTFGTIDSKMCTNSHEDISEENLEGSEELGESKTHKKTSITSLAGSYLSLPKFKPYSAHDCENLTSFEQLPEKERSNFDYTRECSSHDDVKGSKAEKNNDATDNELKGYEEEDYNSESSFKKVDEETIAVHEEIEDIAEDLWEKCLEKFDVVTSHDVLEENTLSGEEIEDLTDSFWKENQEKFEKATSGQDQDNPEEILATSDSIPNNIHENDYVGILEEEKTDNANKVTDIVQEMDEQTILEEIYETKTVSNEEVDDIDSDVALGNIKEHFVKTELSEARSENETFDHFIPEV